MQHHAEPGPADRDPAREGGAGRSGPATRAAGTSGATRSPRSPRSRGVAAALAAALLAGGVTAWLTRPSDAESPPASDGRPALAVATPPTPPTPSTATSDAPAAGSDRAGRDAARPATGAAQPQRQQPAPSRLQIERVGIDMPVVPVGVARDGEMALPETPARAGWYRFGPRPGDPAGATVLAAHLDMPGYGVGPIAAVDELRRGDVVTVRSGAVTTRYTVTSVESTRKTSLDLAALFARDGPAVLHVVTCGGDFDRERRRYDENVVVTAVPTA